MWLDFAKPVGRGLGLNAGILGLNAGILGLNAGILGLNAGITDRGLGACEVNLRRGRWG